MTKLYKKISHEAEGLTYKVSTRLAKRALGFGINIDELVEHAAEDNTSYGWVVKYFNRKFIGGIREFVQYPSYMYGIRFLGYESKKVKNVMVITDIDFQLGKTITTPVDNRSVCFYVRSPFTSSNWVSIFAPVRPLKIAYTAEDDFLFYLMPSGKPKGKDIEIDITPYGARQELGYPWEEGGDKHPSCMDFSDKALAS